MIHIHTHTLEKKEEEKKNQKKNRLIVNINQSAIKMNYKKIKESKKSKKRVNKIYLLFYYS